MAFGRFQGRRLSLSQFLLLAGVALVLVWFGGLVWFAERLPRAPAAPGVMTGGIVVLTGGEQRLSVATELLNRGMGERLLVTGVNRDTARVRLKKLMGGSPDLFDCCVDLGREAKDTVGNAVETSDWAARHSYGSLRVVTSSYHMPRSMAELHAVMPGVILIAHPVLTDAVKLERWWRWPGTSRLLAWEYTKYLFSLTRIRAVRLFSSISQP